MDLQESALAHARRNKRIFNGFFTAKTDLAPNFISLLLNFGLVLLKLENHIILVEVIGVPDGECLASILHFNNHVLDSPHFYNVSGF